MEGSQREGGLGGLIHREQSRASAGGTASTGGTTSTDSTDEHGQHGQHGLARSYPEWHGVPRSYTEYTDLHGLHGLHGQHGLLHGRLHVSKVHTLLLTTRLI